MALQTSAELIIVDVYEHGQALFAAADALADFLETIGMSWSKGEAPRTDRFNRILDRRLADGRGELIDSRFVEGRGRVLFDGFVDRRGEIVDDRFVQEWGRILDRCLLHRRGQLLILGRRRLIARRRGVLGG